MLWGLALRWLVVGRLLLIAASPPPFPFQSPVFFPRRSKLTRAHPANSWNIRLMWREGGAGEVYAYLPPENRGLCSHPNRCDGQFGFSFGRGTFHFLPGQWNRIGLYVQLNAPASNNNGHLELTVNGQRVVGLGNVRFTQADHAPGPLLPSHLVFSTFFGGDTPEHAAPTGTSVLFKDFQLSVGSNFSSTTSSARRTAQPSSLQGGWGVRLLLAVLLAVPLLWG
jgi:hypothetical protein